jgi:hypothetical protein
MYELSLCCPLRGYSGACRASYHPGNNVFSVLVISYCCFESRTLRMLSTLGSAHLECTSCFLATRIRERLLLVCRPICAASDTCPSDSFEVWRHTLEATNPSSTYGEFKQHGKIMPCLLEGGPWTAGYRDCLMSLQMTTPPKRSCVRKRCWRRT